MSDKLYDVVASRAKYRCEYCHSPEEPCGYKFHVEHIIPKSKGGGDELENLALCCAPCNLHKSNKEELDGVRFFHPRKDSWDEHFCWNEDYTLISGKTETGKATISALNMNSPRLVRARKHWKLGSINYMS